MELFEPKINIKCIFFFLETLSVFFVFLKETFKS